MFCSENDPASEKCWTVAVHCLAQVHKLQEEPMSCECNRGLEKLSVLCVELRWGQGGTLGASIVSDLALSSEGNKGHLINALYFFTSASLTSF